jgi:NitT/TauT family transport system substrate-binding protein
MGVSRIADLAPLYIGVEQGFFRDENIELDLQPQQGGSVTITGVVSGDFQLGFANTGSMLVAATKGLPLRAIAPAASVGTDPEKEDFTAIMVRPDSPINSVEDLAGKTIAVNTIQSMVDTFVRASLDATGVDSSSVNFLEIPFPDQVAALEAGQVDVITPQEPYLTGAEDHGLKTVLSGYCVTAIPHFTNGVYFTSEQFMQESPDVVEGLQRALTRSVEYANSHTDEVRASIPSFTGVDPQIAERIALPLWEPQINRETTEELADLLIEYKLLDERPDVAEIVGTSS